MGADDVPLTSEFMAWLALRQVQEGGVAVLDGGYYRHGRPVPQYLNAPLSELVESGRLGLADSGRDAAGLRRVTVTEIGRQWYAALGGKCATSPVLRAGSCPCVGCLG